MVRSHPIPAFFGCRAELSCPLETVLAEHATPHLNVHVPDSQHFQTVALDATLQDRRGFKEAT
jgi:hypothetical protein